MNQNQTVGAFARAPSREEKEVTLPSGRKVTILETTGHEEKIFRFGGGKKNVPALINKYYAAVCRNLDGAEGPAQVSQFESMLCGDRVMILLQSRMLTHGQIMEYNLDCPSCQERSTHEIDLQKIVEETKPYPKGNEREHCITFPEGTLWFELSTGLTEKKLADEKDPDVNAQLELTRIWEKTSHGDVPVRLENLKSKQISVLRKAIKELECEIEATVITTCPSCSQKTPTNLVGDPSFLFPNMT